MSGGHAADWMGLPSWYLERWSDGKNRLKPGPDSDIDRGAQIWDLYEGKHLLYGIDPTEKRYLTRAHLTELVAMLGLPPMDML